jgi:hypothetical protein
MVKEAIALGNNRLENIVIKYEYFTRANDVYIRCDIYSNTL